MKIIFYDTETSGLNEEDRLYQLAYRVINFKDWTIEKDFNERFNIPVTISLEASKINGTLNKDISHLPLIHESDKFKEILIDFNIENAIYVAHNALFDVAMLNKEKIKVPNFIDTKHVSKTYLGKRVMNHKLQTLRDFFKIDIDAKAHDALGDVIVLEKVFQKLFHEVRFRETLTVKLVSDIIRYMETTSIDGIRNSRFSDERDNFQKAIKFNDWKI